MIKPNEAGGGSVQHCKAAVASVIRRSSEEAETVYLTEILINQRHGYGFVITAEILLQTKQKISF